MREPDFDQLRLARRRRRRLRPAILHSCGQLESVWDEIIDDLRYDGKHSYEDKILPVEEAYERYGGRIAILGGIDLDFVCRRTPAEIAERCRALSPAGRLCAGHRQQRCGVRAARERHGHDPCGDLFWRSIRPTAMRH